MINGLQDITPAVHSQVKRKVKKTIRGLNDISDLRQLQDACAKSHSYWSETASECIIASTKMSERQHQGITDWLDGAEEDVASARSPQEMHLIEWPAQKAEDSNSPKAYFIPMPWIDIDSTEISPLLKACKDSKLGIFHGPPFNMSAPSHTKLIHIYCDVNWSSIITAIVVGRGTARENYVIRIDDRLSSDKLTYRRLLGLMEERLEIFEEEPKWLAKPLGISRSELVIDLR